MQAPRKTYAAAAAGVGAGTGDGADIGAGPEEISALAPTGHAATEEEGSAAAAIASAAIARHRAGVLAATVYTSPLPLCRAMASVMTVPCAATIYYDARWIAAAALPRYLTDVPAGAGGGILRLQDGACIRDAHDVTAATADPPLLLTPDERIRARKKVIATWDWAVATGAGHRQALLPLPRWLVTLYAGTCQMDHPLLEPRLFVVPPGSPRIAAELARAEAKGRAPTLIALSCASPPAAAEVDGTKKAEETRETKETEEADLKWGDAVVGSGVVTGGDAVVGKATEKAEKETQAEPSAAATAAVATTAAGTTYFDAGAYRACIAEDMTLLLAAFEGEVAKANGAGATSEGKQGYLKLPPLGLGAGIATADGHVVGPLMFAPFLAGLRDALCARVAWPWLAAVELPFLTVPRWLVDAVPVRLVTGWHARRDVLSFSDAEAVGYVCGVVSPGAAFCLPGNGRTAGSLDSVIADNTTQRRTAWYLYNPAVLDPRNHVAVDTAFAGAVRWWPPAEWSLLAAAPPKRGPQARLQARPQAQARPPPRGVTVHAQDTRVRARAHGGAAGGAGSSATA